MKVRLTTEIYGLGEHNATNIYPYNYTKDFRKLDVSGKKQIVINEFSMEDASRVEIFWGGQNDTTNILWGNQVFDIPENCHEIIFVLDPLHMIDHAESNDRVAEFDFELL